MKTSTYLFLASLMVIMTLSAGMEVLRYDIIKSYSSDIHQNRKVNLGVLQVRRNPEYREVESSIEPKFSQLISKEQFSVTGDESVILSFVPRSSAGTESEGNIYKTAIVQKQDSANDEVISVVVGVDLKIKAINYIEEIRTEVITTGPGKEQVAKIDVANKKAPGAEADPENQSFFTKYKWPIIIGIVLLYVTSQGNPEKQEGAGGAQAAR